jgi:class 3 adenylate cyclase
MLPVRSGPELPSGTVTFLFTDIEGSTRLLKRLREGYNPQWGALLDQLWVR